MQMQQEGPVSALVDQAYLWIAMSGFLFSTGCMHPLNVVESPSTRDHQIEIMGPDDRAIPLRILTPEKCFNASCPLIIFSHGAFAASDRYDALLLPLRELGYRIVAPNHTDSEKHYDRNRYEIDASLSLRIEDYETIRARFEAPYVIAMGHSYGAMIAQIAGGALHGSRDGAVYSVDEDHRPDFIVALSPPGLYPGLTTESWHSVSRPMLVVTGTEDTVSGIADNWQDHLVSYKNAPADLSYALIYEGMDHYFNGIYGREKAPRSATEEALRLAAIGHLTKTIDFFARHQLLKGDIERSVWLRQSADKVQAIH